MYIDWFDILKKHVKKCDFTGTGFSQKKTSFVMLSNRSHMVEQVCSTLQHRNEFRQRGRPRPKFASTQHDTTTS